ncbi:MAG TPA: RnfH family protein [Aquabacterium sp.]|nr:RnfH family protein [Aquabacterium sp.]
MAPAEPLTPEMAIELVFAESPQRLHRARLRLPPGATVADALRASGWRELLGAELVDGLRVGVWGRPCEPQAVLRDRDRIELYRPLQVDPKEARRQRYRRDGMRRAPR